MQECKFKKEQLPGYSQLGSEHWKIASEKPISPEVQILTSDLKSKENVAKQEL